MANTTNERMAKIGDEVVLIEDIRFDYSDGEYFLAKKGNVYLITDIDDEGIWLSDFYVQSESIKIIKNRKEVGK